ncbi:MAG: hypothetical protein LBU32_30945 [Clostridiales bacterium]|jgi:hypothetical protein|nr:hypothetical protein [Clostridiales bacterium]
MQALRIKSPLEGMKRIFCHIGSDNMNAPAAQVLKRAEGVFTFGFSRFKAASSLPVAARVRKAYACAIL